MKFAGNYFGRQLNSSMLFPAMMPIFEIAGNGVWSAGRLQHFGANLKR